MTRPDCAGYQRFPGMVAFRRRMLLFTALALFVGTILPPVETQSRTSRVGFSSQENIPPSCLMCSASPDFSAVLIGQSMECHLISVSSGEHSLRTSRKAKSYHHLRSDAPMLGSASTTINSCASSRIENTRYSCLLTLWTPGWHWPCKFQADHQARYAHAGHAPKCLLYAGANGDMNSDSIIQGRQLLAKPRMP
jgi:hypothetical protein